MNAKLRRFAILTLLAMFASGLSACNTMKGAGKDVEAAGEEIQEEVDDAADAE